MVVWRNGLPLGHGGILRRDLMEEPKDTYGMRVGRMGGANQATGPMMAASVGLLRPQEIGWAVKQMWNGQAVTRQAWYGRHSIRIQRPDDRSKMTEPYVFIMTERGEVIPWLASQADLLATDWVIQEV